MSLQASVADTRAWVTHLLRDRPGITHGLAHIERVYTTTVLLAAAEQASDDVTRLAELVALLHDVADHKYDHDGRLRRALLERYGPELVRLVDAVSFSQQCRADRAPAFTATQQQALDLVRDADRLDALGEAGIERCRQYTREQHPTWSPAEIYGHVRQHVTDKLARLYPEHFIVTAAGRARAQPLHQAVQLWADHYDDENEKRAKTL